MKEIKGPAEQVSVNVPEGQRAAFLQLWEDFVDGKVRVSTPALGFGSQSFREAAASVFADPSTTYVLRKRIADDASRDPAMAITDAETLHALASKRFNEEAVPRGAPVHDLTDQLERAGVQSLKRLYQVACGDTGQSGRIARFLLGLYNGARFPFDLTDLRAIDDALFDDCMRVLSMDARVTRREVHSYFEQGGEKWEAMAEDWRVPDRFRLECIAKDVIRSGLANFGGRSSGGDTLELATQLRVAMKTCESSES